MSFKYNSNFLEPLDLSSRFHIIMDKEYPKMFMFHFRYTWIQQNLMIARNNNLMLEIDFTQNIDKSIEIFPVVIVCEITSMNEYIT